MTVGLALGGGAARGWSHIGAIRALTDMGIDPDIVCGTSIGALVGASLVSSRLDKLEQWVRSLSRFNTARFFEINATLSGFVNKDRMRHFLTDYVGGEQELIESLDHRFASVATDIETGREIWLQDGPLIDAIWASMALPGLFPAIRNRDRWLVDGGLVNPVPVSACRALGADRVIAVNLNGDVVGKHFREPPGQEAGSVDQMMKRFHSLVADYTDLQLGIGKPEDQPPSLFDAIAGSINIMQDRITRSRMAGDPPDIILAPKLGHIGLLEFYRAEEAISEGEQCVRRMSDEIRHVMNA